MNFAVIGLGFVAPRHLKAIKDVGGTIVAALDPHDSVGILDSFEPSCRFFTEFERFDRYLDKVQRAGTKIDYVTVCSPNYLHDSHCRFALRIGADAICEKPLVINPWNIDALSALEIETGHRIHPVLQLRHATIVQNLKAYHFKTAQRVTLKYHTPRGYWYSASWKADKQKSGGMILNIGVHLFDLMLYLFGSCHHFEVESFKPMSASGKLCLERATVDWSLSIDPQKCGDGPIRTLSIEGTEVDLSKEFTNLHTTLYQHIIEGKGFSLVDAKRAIHLIHNIRKYCHDV